jgi:hypothetical protein
MQKPWVAGEVIIVDGEMVTIQTYFGRKIQLLLNDEVYIPIGREFVAGDRIRAVGEWDGDLFVVKAIVGGKKSVAPGPGKVEGFRNFRKGI